MAVLLCCGGTPAQTSRTVKLKPTAGGISLKNVYIAAVTDDRADTATIGTMRTGTTRTEVPVNIEAGAATAIRRYIGEHVSQQAPDTFALHITKLQVGETTKGLQEEAALDAAYAFYRNGQKVVDYSGGYTARTSADASVYIGKLVSQSLEQVLREFDSWWAINYNQYRDPNQQEVSVTVLVKNNSNDPEQIGYDAGRPLHIEDFNGKPDKQSVALAATYSGFSLQYELTSDYKGTTANITLLPYFDKNRSWMKADGKNAYVLQHEQLHFDIAAMKTYELATALRKLKVTVAAFREAVDSLQKQYSRETEQLQSVYDEDTGHGAQKSRQLLWEGRIKADLNDREAAAGR